MDLILAAWLVFMWKPLCRWLSQSVVIGWFKIAFWFTLIAGLSVIFSINMLGMYAFGFKEHFFHYAESFDREKTKGLHEKHLRWEKARRRKEAERERSTP
jgi:hypothetical protein